MITIMLRDPCGSTGLLLVYFEIEVVCISSPRHIRKTICNPGKFSFQNCWMNIYTDVFDFEIARININSESFVERAENELEILFFYLLYIKCFGKFLVFVGRDIQVYGFRYNFLLKLNF